MSYLKNRQNPLHNTPTEKVELAFAKIANYFGKIWLEGKHGNHSLQALWSRQDALSTNELFTFGSSLIAAEQISAEWLKRQIKLIRGKNENNQRGAIFEILTVGYASSKQKVTPASANKPGYDIDIEASNGMIYRASLKRYSQSSHEIDFIQNSKLAENKFLEALNQSSLNAQIYIEAQKHPDESDWQNLYIELPKFVSGFKNTVSTLNIEDKWRLFLNPLIFDTNENPDKRYVSYNFHCLSPYHNNEQNNLTSKIEAAFANLERHVKSDKGVLPIIIFQLPATASASTLATWSQEYLDAKPSSSAQAVFFLQPFITSIQGKSFSIIAHFISCAFSKKFASIQRQPLDLRFPVGIMSEHPPSWQIQSSIGSLKLTDKYVYQKGKHYIRSSTNNAGGLSGTVAKKAPGIETITVFDIYGKTLMASGKWVEELYLIGG